MKPNILHCNGLGFVIIPKCGGTSVKTAIRKTMGFDDSQGIHADDRLRYTFKPEGAHTIAFVRNPFDRLVSAYENKVKAGKPSRFKTFKKLGYREDMSFAEFVKHSEGRTNSEDHTAQQIIFLPKNTSAIYRFEEMAAVWEMLRGEHSWLAPLPHLNASGKADWESYYTPEIKALAAKIYQKDVEIWDSL